MVFRQMAHGVRMDAARFEIDPPGGRFCHEVARRAHADVIRKRDVHLVVIDLRRAVDATTSAFAQLVLLRRELLRSGRDLRLDGLHARAAHVYHVNRLDHVLPCHGFCPGPPATSSAEIAPDQGGLAGDYDRSTGDVVPGALSP
jgi:hypothetical protein